MASLEYLCIYLSGQPRLEFTCRIQTASGQQITEGMAAGVQNKKLRCHLLSHAGSRASGLEVG